MLGHSSRTSLIWAVFKSPFAPAHITQHTGHSKVPHITTFLKNGVQLHKLRAWKYNLKQKGKHSNSGTKIQAQSEVLLSVRLPSLTQTCIQLFKSQLQRNSAPEASEVSLLISTVACLSHHSDQQLVTHLSAFPHTTGEAPQPYPSQDCHRMKKESDFFYLLFIFLMLWNGGDPVQPAWVLCCKKLL